MAVSKRTRYEPPPMPPGVNTGRPCMKYHDGTIKRQAIPAHVRRTVALRYGATPGHLDSPAGCQYCGAPGIICWPIRRDGKPGAWVHFGGLQLDHIYPYSKGGSTIDADNFVLACKSCNSSKCDRLTSDWTGVGI